MKMAQIFTSYCTQSEFKRLYRTLLPRLDICSNCGRVDECKNCRDFYNTIKFFYKNTNKDQWNYLCNFFNDLLNIHEKTEKFFKDVKLPRRIENTWFCTFDKNINNSVRILENASKSCYMFGNKKYKCFREKQPVINEFFKTSGLFVRQFSFSVN